MPPKKAPNGYKVANPRGIPAGRFIVRTTRGGETTAFYEGDAIEPSDAFSPQGWKSWIDGGFVVEVSDGASGD